MPDFYATINDAHFDHILSLSEKAEREDAVRSNDAFTAAMRREIKRGKVKVRAGTFVDTSPAIYARRIRGEAAMSCIGSPAALCADIGGAPGGAEAMK
jgi:hypothetical protein